MKEKIKELIAVLEKRMQGIKTELNESGLEEYYTGVLAGQVDIINSMLDALSKLLSFESISKGVDLIKAERIRQIEFFVFDKEHDKKYTDQSLALTACHYALPNEIHSFLNLWPRSWNRDWNKKGSNRLRDLEKAGALIAAEIDRLIEKEKEYD